MAIFKKIKRHLECLILIVLFLSVISCNKKSKTDLRFAFTGDIHYSIPDYKTTDNLVQSVAKELNSLNPKA